MNRLIEKLTFAPDLTRGLRAAIAFSGALLICYLLGKPLALPFVSTIAVHISLSRLRGAYHIRSAILGGMILVLTGAAYLGALTSGNTAAAVAGIGALALLSGWWRQLSPDYGAPLSIGSALLYLLALEGPIHGATPAQISLWTALGGAGATLLHLGLWLFKPQHALRHSVAEVWMAVADLFLSLRPGPPGETSADHHLEQQRLLRETLDRTAAVLTAAEASRGRTPLVTHLDQMRHKAAHFAMHAVAFRTAIEPLLQAPEFNRDRPLIDSLMTECANVARSITVALVTHRHAHLGMVQTRALLCERFIRLLSEQLAANTNNHGATSHSLRLLEVMNAELFSIQEALAETVDPSGTTAAPPFALSDASRGSIRRLAGGIHSASLAPDPVLFRYSLRMSVLSMICVAAYMVFAIPHGYWMALAMIVVLQPDYGSTRQRGLQRVGGTFAGALLAGAFAASPAPRWLLGVLATGMAFGFAYFLRRSYATAVFFVTVMLVLATEMHMPVHLEFAVSRLFSNLIGAALAFIAALYFWPSWEREKLPDLLAKAIRANRDYFVAVTRQLTAGNGYNREVIRTKQQAERAGSVAAASLQRMQSEPERQRENSSQLAALLTSNDRVTNAITVLATHLSEKAHSLIPGNTQAIEAILRAFDQLASDRSFESLHRHEGQPHGLVAASDCKTPVSWSLEKISAELRAMFPTAEEVENERLSQARMP